MSRLVDPTICPDCRGELDAEATCTLCGLQVRGPLASQLWGVMVTADRLVEQLRRAPVVPAAAAPAQPAPLPTYPAAALRPPPKPRRLPSASVPVVLLSLGALCLLVAAVVFIAVTWSLLGLTGRTLVLLALTGILAVVAVFLTRKGLRGAAETFWLVVAGMLTVDLLAAHSAGLLGLDGLSWRGASALVGVPLLALGAGVGAWARHQPVGRLYGAETVSVIGTLVLCSTNVWFAENPAVASTIALPLLAACLVLLRRAVPFAAYGLGGLGVLTWVVLLGIGWDRALETATFTDWWSDVHGWPLLAAAVFAAAAAHGPGIADRLRPVLTGLALLPLVLLANGPQTLGLPTRDLLVACATLVVLGALAASAPRVWAIGAAWLTALGLVILGLWLVLSPWDVLADLYPDGNGDVGLTMQALEGNAASWSFPVASLALVVAAGCALRRLPGTVRRTAAQVVGTLAPPTLALGALVMVLELEPPLWAGVLAAGLATAAGAGAAWWSRDRLVAAVSGSLATAYLATLTLFASSAAHLLAALAATVLAVAVALAGALRERVGAQLAAPVLGAVAALLGGWALVAWTLEAGTGTAARALALGGYAAAVGVLASPLARQLTTRVSLEGSAAVLAVLAVGSSGDEPTSAMVMTIVGTALCLIAVTTRDRGLLGWAGAVVLGLATVLRVANDVSAPELYTLPAAILLVGCGAWRLHTDRRVSSVTVLGSGLTLALLPSLLLALEEPVSLRGAIIGAASVLVLAAGVQQRLAAPFVLGALSTGLLAVRHLQPVADAVPRWISLGGVGLVLLLVGVTWEARRRNLETAHRYLTDLR